MNTQDVLTYLLEVIALGFIAIMTFDFIAGLMPARKQLPAVLPGQLSRFELRSEPLLQIPDPWLLPIEQAALVVAQPPKRAQHQHKPLLLLPPAQEVIGKRSPASASGKSTLIELLVSVDLDKLQLRPARKIAKALGIAQKINGVDQKLDFLRAQIKSKLQQPQTLSSDVVKAVRELLLAG
jgi:hypothetical protein